MQGCFTMANTLSIKNNSSPAKEVALEKGGFHVYKVYSLSNAQWLSDDFLRSDKDDARVALMDIRDKVVVTEYPHLITGPTTMTKPYSFLMTCDSDYFYYYGENPWRLEINKLVYVKDGQVSDVDLSSLKWKQRSRLSIALRYLMCGIAVPLDIVTSPIQLIIVLSSPID